MKVVELLILGMPILKLLQESCINVKDVQFVKMYEEYKSMMASGCKSMYAAMKLSERYGISERQVYYIIKKFDRDCKIGSAV